MDGLKRVLQTKKDVSLHVGAGNSTTQDKMTVSGHQVFDFVGRTIEQYYPVVENLGQQGQFNPTIDNVQPTRSVYDVLDRNLLTTLPDNTVMSSSYG
ncbi:MAG: hypothetical protein BWK79_14075, partial [Beggiatoa sp. IS2]